MIIRVLVFTSFFHMSIAHLKYNHTRQFVYKTWLAGMLVSNEHDCILGLKMVIMAERLDLMLC